MKIKPDQVNLFYTLSGEGPLTFVLLHNAGGNHQFMDKQLKFFSQFGQVLSTDFRGHGQSDKSHCSYTVATFARDIIQVCHAVNISKAIFIGLNFGADVAIEIANCSSLVSHLILMDPPILMKDSVIASLEDHINDLNKPNYKNFSKDLVESVIIKSSLKNKKMAIKAFDTIAKSALVSTYQNLIKWDKSSHFKLEKCTMPILNIQSSTPFCSEDDLAKYCPRIHTGKVVQSGHWVTLETPIQVNSMIKRFLKMQGL